MDIEQVIKLIETVSASELCEFKYEDEECKLKFKADRGFQVEHQSFNGVPAEVTSANLNVSASDSHGEVLQNCGEGSGSVITAPLVGVFYHASSEDAQPFIKVGDQVKKGQVIGIIEAMKLMNEVESEYDGVVESILVGNDQMVEYGQPLVVIK